ncbi:MAG TPA: glutaredoxin domain-containing protein [Polyangiaceae bacterium]|nr:glutaredoxin domain-containing protein [Polyangiaceae bacterium]
MTRVWGAVLALAIAVSSAACKKPTPDTSNESATTPKTNELPPLEVKADTPNLLLTWIDDKGDFHVVQKPADVPTEGRSTVRIVVTNREEGTGNLVYVANLDETTATGAYRLKTMPRAQWEELGASKRKARLEALAPSALPSSSAAPGREGPAGNSPGSNAKAPATGIVAIIYGADWCKPCHDAERYLKQRGATVIKKNIDDNEVAAEEMQKKLARVGRSGASIPVIDIMGQIQVGFSPAALEQALSAARSAKGL